jgi:formylglycine-generating enzyme required for sulfatase activity
MGDLSNSTLGVYHLIEVIRRGGMSTIYKAYQPTLERHVAIKVLPPHPDPQFALRFRREVRANAQLQHPNILPIYDYGEHEGLLYLVTQYIEHGATLGDRLGAPLEPGEALHLAIHVLGALDYAHQHGIIHRDIKPSNILMVSPSWPVLADFGIAKILGDPDDTQVTLPGVLLGTPAYAAPEQVSGAPSDARTDLYALGVVLYEMVTGQVPFAADNPLTMLAKHAYEPLPSPRALNPGLPPPVEAVLLRALAKDPADRYQNAAEMAQALTSVAAWVEQSRLPDQLIGLYQAGVQAFTERQWDAAIERFNRVIALDPIYEDAPDLLITAREAQARARLAVPAQVGLMQQGNPAAVRVQLSPPGAATVPMTAPAAPAPPAGAARSPGAGAARFLPGRRRPAGRAAGRSGSIWLAALGLLFMISGSLFLGRGVTELLAYSAATVPPAQRTPTAQDAPLTGFPSSSQLPAAVPPPAGTLAHADDFDDDSGVSGLEDLRTTPFERGFHSPGVYYIKLPRPNETHWVVLPRLAYGDFSLQIDLWDHSDDFDGNAAQGLIFRLRDNDHFYAFLINSRTGRYSVRKQAGPGAGTDLIPWRFSPLVKHAPEVNQVRLDAAGDTFTIFLNGAPLDSFRDRAYAFGLLGFIVWNEGAATPQMYFDNLQIWQPAPPTRDATVPDVRDAGVGPMVLIPGGEFVMGGTAKSAEQAHIVALPPFYIDRTEVTNALYRRCIAYGRCTPPESPASHTQPGYAAQARFDSFPAIHVTWAQARDFCAWAGKRLPTEAEWEKAASWDHTAGTKLDWPWSNFFNPAWLNSVEAGIGDTTGVGDFPPELNDTFDLAGNVSEWTSSLYRPYPYHAADGREDPQAPGDRVFRGGSWSQTQGKARGFMRQGGSPAYADREIGFRCAADP